MITLEYTNELGFDIAFDALFFENIAFETMQYLKKETQVSISLTIVDEITIQTINKTYRGIDKITDVISFAFDDIGDDIIYTNQMIRPLGDIIICYQRMCQQAASYQHSLKREMAFLYVHGLLHLCGYDHQTKDEETEMFNIQENILNTLGYVRCEDEAI